MRSLGLSLLVLLASARLARADEPTWQGVVLRAGYAATTGPEVATGPRLGIAYRVELPRLAFEVTTEMERLEPDDASWGSWKHSTKAGVRAEYVHAFDDLAVRLGGGLGYGTQQVWRDVPYGGYTYPDYFRQDAAHAELRAGVELGHGPITTIDVGLRLPLRTIDVGTSNPAWYPTVDIAVGVGVGSVPGGRPQGNYETSVVVADLLSAAAMWWGAITMFENIDCEDCGGDEALATTAALVGAFGYVVAAPVLHGMQHHGRGALQSLGFRFGAAVVGAAIGGGEGLVAGMFVGALVAPIADYVIARLARP